MEKNLTMDKLIALCKGRGFIYAGSEIYDGLANSWDYGPLGVELKTTSKNFGGKDLLRKTNIMLGLIVQFS